jgi:hypothetical protein
MKIGFLKMTTLTPSCKWEQYSSPLEKKIYIFVERKQNVSIEYLSG